MEPSEIVRTTRKGEGQNVREFSETLSDILPSGCSSSLVSHWEVKRIRLNYEKMFYLYTHAANPKLRNMAAGVMRELKPERAAADIARYS